MSYRCVLLAFVMCSTLATAQEPQLHEDVIEARLVETGDLRFRAPAGPSVSTAPDHPPMHLISEIHLIDRHLAGPAAAESTTVLMHDLGNQQTVEVAVDSGNGTGALIPGWNGPAGPWDREQEKSFVDLSDVPNTDAFPWRMNAKLVMRFRDTGGSSHYAKCSGSMIDAETVLTAAHCVYAHTLVTDTGTYTINDWAWDVWVYPGWTGTGVNSNGVPSVTEVIEPYGYGHGTSTAAGPGWVNYSTAEEDYGLVRITRAVGMLTGWYGSAAGGNCAWIQGQTYHNASYPSEYCGEPGMYNGTKMYYWWGTIDSCPGNQLRVDVTGGCVNNGWKGMSGSSAYFKDGNDVRFAHAVASTRDLGVSIDFCKINDFWGTYMNGTFIPMSRGDTLDLQALDVHGPPAAQFAGQPIETSTVFVTNPTNGSGANTWTLRAYLSSDDFISDSDTLLGTFSFYEDFAAMESRTVALTPSPTIPVDTPTGFYYLGAILDPATDPVPDNNVTMNWDAHPFTVFGVSDLVAETINAPTGTYETSDVLPFSFDVINQGAAESMPFTVEIRASSNIVITATDALLGSYQYSELAGGGSQSDVVVGTIPFTLASGLWYVGMRIVTDDDADTTNNTAYDPVRITVVKTGLFADGFESGHTSAWSASVP